MNRLKQLLEERIKNNPFCALDYASRLEDAIAIHEDSWEIVVKTASLIFIIIATLFQLFIIFR